jgi:mannose-6-phosphate isomerase
MKNTNPKEILVEKVWGGRSLERLFGKKLPKGKLIGESWMFCDKKYPVVLKLLDVKKPLSVQVHPKGKSEVWYIVEAGKSARAVGGITLDEYKIKAGDWVYLEAGTVHTIKPPAVIFEVSQSKLVTYRLYDWGRGTRPLDIEEGIKHIVLKAKPKILHGANSFKCPYFSIKRYRLKVGEKISMKGVCFVLKGCVKTGNRIINKGDALIVKETVQATAPAVVFSVNWTIRSSSKSR